MEASAVIQAIEPLKPKFALLGMKRLLLVGSTARGESTPSSDVDFVVEFEGATTFNAYMELIELLEGAIGKPVDLSTIKSLRAEIATDVLSGALQVA